MTKIGYENIKKRIKEHVIYDIPTDFNHDQLTCWLLGYNSAIRDIEKILDELSESQGG